MINLSFPILEYANLSFIELDSSRVRLRVVQSHAMQICTRENFWVVKGSICVSNI